MKLEHFFTLYTKIIHNGLNTKSKARNYKILRGKHRQNTLWYLSQQDHLWSTSENDWNNNKKKMASRETSKYLSSKENYKQDEKTTLRRK